MIKGIQKNRKDAKILLKVTKIRTAADGKTMPSNNPRIIAMMTLGSNPILNIKSLLNKLRMQ